MNPLILREDITARGTEELVPFSTVVEIKAPPSQTLRFNYSYALFTESREPEWERDPSRILEILPSESYRGQLGNSNQFQFVNTAQTFFVNGIIDKNDGFFHKNFQMSQIGNLNLFMGPYPYKNSEVAELQRKNINAVLNLQTQEEM